MVGEMSTSLLNAHESKKIKDQERSSPSAIESVLLANPSQFR
jgi:hypothetical protein